MPRFKQAIRVDDDVLDVLMRDMVGHDQQAAAYHVFIWLYRQARVRWKSVRGTLRVIAEETGLSKSAVRTASQLLRRRQVIETSSERFTAAPQQRVLRYWQKSGGRG